MSDEVFKPWGDGERRIFKFHDGVKERAVDPIAVFRKLNAVPGLAVETDLALAGVGQAGGEFAKQAEEAITRLVAGCRVAFGLAEFGDDGAGLTESECLSLLRAFGSFLGGLAESARPLPSSPPPTEAAASSDTIPPS